MNHIRTENRRVDLVKDKANVYRELSTAQRLIGYQRVKDGRLHALEATIHCTRTQITQERQSL